MKRLVISFTFVFLQCLLLLAAFQNNILGNGFNKPDWPLEVLSWDINKAYPGIEYNYRLGVKGGEYPYEFTLVDGPSGMTINNNTGEILWTPVGESENNEVIVLITDKSGNTLEHQFDITSTTTGFYFVDGANGVDNTNTGSESSPWKTIAYASATADSASYVYVKKGTYTGSFSILTTNCGRFMAYPGDLVTVVSSGERTGIGIVSVKRGLFQGFVFDANNKRWFFNVQGKSQNIIWRKNEMKNSLDTTSENPACIFFANQKTRYTNMVMQDNIFHAVRDPKVHHGASVTTYQMTNSLFEDNHVYDIDGRGFNEKVGGRRNTIRSNVFHDIYNYPAIIINSNPSSDSTEICYNLIYNCINSDPSDVAIQIGANGSYVANIFVHHNTCAGNIRLQAATINSDTCTNINIYKNIIGVGTKYPYTIGSAGNGLYPKGFRYKVLIDSNIVFGKVDSSQIAGFDWGITKCNWVQWQDSGKDVNSILTNPGLDANYALPPTSPYYGIYGRDYYKLITDVKMSENENSNRKEYSLSQNYPNPFNPSTTIKFTIPESPLSGGVRGGFITLKIFDILGREVATLVNEHKPAGTYTVEWNGTNSAGQSVGSGIYLYQLKTSSGFLETKKMLMIK